MAIFTKKDVIRAGQDLIKDEVLLDTKKFSKTMEILTYWRDSHIEPLNQAEILLYNTATKVDKSAFIAKRIKRLPSIKKKLKRFQDMQLKNMNDIAGIRVVVSNIGDVEKIYNILSEQDCFKKHDGNFIRIDDYINNPKSDGYRCLHMIGKFQNEYNEERKVEFQIRTQLQHSWATTLEIVDIFTTQDLKSNKGLLAWHDFFKNVSEQFQILEYLQSFSSNDVRALIKEYIQKVHNKPILIRQCNEIHNFVSKTIGQKSIELHLEEYCNLLQNIEIPPTNTKENGFVLIRLNTKVKSLASEFFSQNDKDKALELYSQYEQTLSNNKDWIVALIATDAIGGLRQAYPNYFADSQVFLKYIALIKMVAQVINLSKSVLHKR